MKPEKRKTNSGIAHQTNTWQQYRPLSGAQKPNRLWTYLFSSPRWCEADRKDLDHFANCLTPGLKSVTQRKSTWAHGTWKRGPGLGLQIRPNVKPRVANVTQSLIPEALLQHRQMSGALRGGLGKQASLSVKRYLDTQNLNSEFLNTEGYWFFYKIAPCGKLSEQNHGNLRE